MKIEADLHNLDEVVACIKKSGKKIVLLQGTLGSGKTTLVKVFAKKEPVTSPTFSIQQIYGGEIYHYDLYNAGFEKFLELGLFEELEKPGYHFIEWADENMEEFLRQSGFSYLKILITPQKEKRVYECILS
ncbi:tRNA threonylcarbamoyladenosine biosynthesis protein TsaE [Nitratiruptor sp. YY08-26]|uniref:tRNA (adenosine(37)-N6)-threonylcarbamoyltransferase complex ATPase subunit type 1 TsaE n=1 Tax=unclassified Nitratiruptor TaxID=2624044 RepID=UPI001915A33D|nr:MULTISPECIES: tRNA (adenosine(37)-N6)-threonylcarbamoyltransferase complex ATPase subunit type 1 TsaE [unclassified Nitratiruptor]BCD62362.1 tRNA threonylcarbamoyladenosine biosynthesis protein TsaE [Nitratiruptor sp. YY08-13]BCD66298.1 tRNA threonylcarbamoyladenosine biosynthesis protein TsaE [Nitratiruptor sp. YY08-26]